ncbi:MAG: hypothetical protein JWQ55_3196 [Rhodopila sp.]|nr:hypothetical protein [Rhodopila sp.]
MGGEGEVKHFKPQAQQGLGQLQGAGLLTAFQPQRGIAAGEVLGIALQNLLLHALDIELHQVERSVFFAQFGQGDCAFGERGCNFAGGVGLE